MISAVDALRLPPAKLSDEQIASVTKILEEIDVAVQEHMCRNGCNIKVAETDGAVIAEVNQRLKRLGWNTAWSPVNERHPLNKALMVHVGYMLGLAPSDASYIEADAISLS